MICTAYLCAAFMGYGGPYIEKPQNNAVAAIAASVTPSPRPAYKPRRSAALKPTAIAYAASLPKPSAPFEALIGNSGLKLVKVDGNEVLKFTPAMQRILRDVQNHFGKPVEIQSGYRSPSYNRRVRGAKHSQHMTGNAADIRVAGISPSKLLAYLRSNPRVGGIGHTMRGGYIHADARKNRVEWRYK